MEERVIKQSKYLQIDGEMVEVGWDTLSEGEKYHLIIGVSTFQCPMCEHTYRRYSAGDIHCPQCGANKSQRISE